MKRPDHGQEPALPKINDSSHVLVVDPRDVWGLKSTEQTAEDPMLEGLPPSQEVFKDMVNRGDAAGIVNALEAASRVFIARAEAATDEAIRELRRRGASEEEINQALKESGWELTEFGAHPIGQRHRNGEYQQEAIVHPPKNVVNIQRVQTQRRAPLHKAKFVFKDGQLHRVDK